MCVCVSFLVTVCTSCKEEQLKPIALSLNNKSNLCVHVCVCVTIGVMNSLMEERLCQMC